MEMSKEILNSNRKNRWDNLKIKLVILVHVVIFLYLCKVFVSKMNQILIVIGIIAIAMLLLSVRVLLMKNGKFSSQHISENKRMKQDGIHCATSQDREARRKNTNKIDIHKI